MPALTLHYFYKCMEHNSIYTDNLNVIVVVFNLCNNLEGNHADRKTTDLLRSIQLKLFVFFFRKELNHYSYQSVNQVLHLIYIALFLQSNFFENEMKCVQGESFCYVTQNKIQSVMPSPC